MTAWRPLFSRRTTAADICSYVVVPAIVGFFTIAGVLVTSPALPVEHNDETVHTFIDVPMFLSSARSGTLLKIDLRQNFGTPLLGDSVVAPLAPHAATYALFKPLTAMLINKVVLAGLSTVVLTAFFAAYNVLPVASLCAVLVVTSPTFFYFLQNHPHQGALLYFGLVLLAARSFLGSPTRFRLVRLFAASLVFCVGVGMNGVILGLAFIGAFVLLASDSTWRTRALALTACGLAVAAIAPHVAEFVRLAGLSARIQMDYQTIPRFMTSGTAFLGGLLVLPRHAALTGVGVSYSPAVLAFIGFGLALLGRRHPRDQVWRLAVLLGLVPLLVVVALRLFPSVAGSIPLVRSTNVTRILWFSDVFLILAVGVAIERCAQLHLTRRQLAYGVTALLIGLIPRLLVAWWQIGDSRSVEGDIAFQPRSFLQVMKAGTRLATDLDPVPGNFDMKAIPNGLFASSGRSILMNDRFRSALLSEDLIETGWLGMTYYFKPSAPERLARLGIRYFATEDHGEQLAAEGWHLRAADKGFSLYESPLPVTPVYIDGPQPEFIDTYAIGGNRVVIGLPQARRHYNVVATFVALSGWKATIDGQPVAIQPGPDGLLSASVDDGRQLVFEYEPYSDRAIFTVFGVSLLLVGAAAWWLERVMTSTLQTVT